MQMFNDIGYLILKSAEASFSMQEICDKVCMETGDDIDDAIVPIAEFVESLVKDGILKRSSAC